MIRIKYLIAGLLLALPLTGGAECSSQDDSGAIGRIYGLRPSYDQCLRKAGAIATSQRDCMNVELQYQGGRLNAAYKSLMGKLDATYQLKLKSYEKNWIEYRDSNCADEIFGVEQPQNSALECTVEETAKRASILEGWLFQRDGD